MVGMLALSASAQNVTYSGLISLLKVTGTNTTDIVASSTGFVIPNAATNAAGTLINLEKSSSYSCQVTVQGLAVDTNAVTSGITFYASNSLDHITWIADPARNFTVSFSTTNVVNITTNFNSVGALGYETYGIGNPTGSHGIATNSSFGYAIKRGL